MTKIKGSRLARKRFEHAEAVSRLHSSRFFRHSSFGFRHSFSMDYITILAATVPVYLMMLLGGVVRRLGWLPREADAAIMSLAIKVLTPCLAFERIVGNE